MPSVLLIVLIIALAAGAGLVKNTWLKVGFRAALIVVLVLGIAGVFG